MRCFKGSGVRIAGTCRDFAVSGAGMSSRTLKTYEPVWLHDKRGVQPIARLGCSHDS